MHKIIYSTRLRYLAITYAALLLAGCIHIPIQTQLSHSSANSPKQQSTRCTPDNSLSQESATAKSGLSPKRISVLSWNMYKQSRNNWATDFHRFSHDQDLLILQEAYLAV